MSDGFPIAQHQIDEHQDHDQPERSVDASIDAVWDLEDKFVVRDDVAIGDQIDEPLDPAEDVMGMLVGQADQPQSRSGWR